MSYVIPALTAPDGYTTLSTIQPGVELDRFIVDVANGAIYWQLAFGPGLGNWEGTETPMIPGSRVILERAKGIRFRAFTPLASLPAGQLQAVVTVRAVET